MSPPKVRRQGNVKMTESPSLRRDQRYTQMRKCIGIDLGTTFSAMAIVNRHGQPEILVNREGERITPSVVLFDGEAPIVGNIAKRSAVSSPLNVAQFVKRQMGNSSWKFTTENGAAFSPEDISAIILKRLKEDAEMILGETVEDAVITVPAYFDDAQRKATQDAGRMAGLNVLRIINEPTAAALFYGFKNIQEHQTLLVYDLGGGTFDVTIMEVGNGEINVKATGGDKNLGGFNWDNEIMSHLNGEFQRLGGPDLFADPTLEQDLRDKAEIAKVTLSLRDKTNVFLSAGRKTSSISFTREQFELLTASLLERTAAIMNFVLEDAGLDWSGIDKVLLAGGSTRMKSVGAMVEKVSGKKPSSELHPDEVVALGAALQGALLQVAAGNSDLIEVGSFPIVEISDVNSHSMGVVVRGEANSIVLKKDTPYGTRVSDTFCTMSKNQEQIRVRITEGEGTDLANVKEVGEAEMKIPPYPEGAPIEVTFVYNANGLIQVSVFDATAKRALGEIIIRRTSNLTEREVREKKLKIDVITIS